MSDIEPAPIDVSDMDSVPQTLDPDSITPDPEPVAPDTEPTPLDPAPETVDPPASEFSEPLPATPGWPDPAAPLVWDAAPDADPSEPVSEVAEEGTVTDQPLPSPLPESSEVDDSGTELPPTTELPLELQEEITAPEPVEATEATETVVDADQEQTQEAAPHPDDQYTPVDQPLEPGPVRDPDPVGLGHDPADIVDPPITPDGPAGESAAEAPVDTAVTPEPLDEHTDAPLDTSAWDDEDPEPLEVDPVTDEADGPTDITLSGVVYGEADWTLNSDGTQSPEPVDEAIEENVVNEGWNANEDGTQSPPDPEPVVVVDEDGDVVEPELQVVPDGWVEHSDGTIGPE